MDSYWSENFENANDEKNHQQEVRIILLGRTGLCKSSVDNSICGSRQNDNPFRTNSSSVTRTSQYAYRDYNERRLCVIDTPGLSDTEQSNEIIIDELKKAFHLASPGPHAFLIVTNGGITREQISVLELLEKVFGKNVLNYCIMVITREDELRHDNGDEFLDEKLINLYFNEVPQSVLNLVNSIGKRCVLINNRAPHEMREKK